MENTLEAVIDVDGVRFDVEVTETGISALRLPPLRPEARGLPVAPGVRTTIECPAADGVRADHLDLAGRYLAALLHGRASEVVPTVDLRGLRPFTVRVLEVVRRVGWGEVRSYAEVAIAAGSPRGARAAGQALARNPVPMLIPCHRVVRSDGTSGGWSASPGWKECLLSLEGSSRAVSDAGNTVFTVR